jgi:hypothetical protein
MMVIPLIFAATILGLAKFVSRSDSKPGRLPETTIIAACVLVPLQFFRYPRHQSEFLNYGYPYPEAFGLETIQVGIIRFFMQFRVHRVYPHDTNVGYPFPWHASQYDVSRGESDPTAFLLNAAVFGLVIWITYRIERAYQLQHEEANLEATDTMATR